MLGKTLYLVVLVQAAAIIGGPALNIYLTARPRPSASAGTGSVMTEPAATSAPSPIWAGATIMVSEPMKASLPMTVLCLCTPS